MTHIEQDRNRLFIGDLPMNLDQSFLEELLRSECASEHGIQIDLKEARSGMNKYAFVQFEDAADAKKVIDNLNYTKLDGVAIRISYSDSETLRIIKKNEGNLFIRKLSAEIEVSQLHEAFQSFGEIISCKIPLTDGKSRGYGFVQFRNPKDAEKAMQDLTDASINNQKIEIERYQRRQKLNPDRTYTNVFIKNLPEKYLNEEAFKALCQSMGEVQSAALAIDATDGKVLPFGYCNFVNHEDAVHCVQELNGREEDGVKIFAGRQQSKKERKQALERAAEMYRREQYEKTKGRNLYVRGFPQEYGDEDLINAFKKFGEIESARVMRDESDQSRQFGFVCFKTVDQANAAIQGTIVGGEGDSLYVALAQRKQDRTIQLMKMRTTAVQGAGHQELQYQPQSLASIQAPQFMVQQALKPRDQITQELQSQPNASVLLKALREVSDQQCEVLVGNQETLNEWINQKSAMV